MFDLIKEIVFTGGLFASSLTDKIAEKSGSNLNTDVADVVIREGMNKDGDIILTNSDITSAKAVAMRQPACDYDWGVILDLSERGSRAFAEATGRIAQKHGLFSVWVGGKRIYSPSVKSAVTSGRCVLSGFLKTFDDAKALADSVNEKLR